MIKDITLEADRARDESCEIEQSFKLFAIVRRYLKMKDIKIACVQMSPISLDSSATTKKIIRYVEKASKKEPKLIVFPELILSGYPNFNISSLKYRKRYNLTAVYSEGPELAQIVKIADEYSIVIVLGFIERDPKFSEVLYDSSCVIDSDGTFVGVHRKIAPLGAEKVVFKAGDAGDIRVFETKIGKIGLGLCFENLNPLYRRALTLLGEEIHCSLWVATNDTRHLVESSARVTAIEGGVPVVLASQVTSSSEPLEIGTPFTGGSGVLDPMGKFITGPIYGREKILYAEIAPESWTVPKFQSRGIEARDDLLSLNLAAEPYHPLYIKKIKKIDFSESLTNEIDDDRDIK